METRLILLSVDVSEIKLKGMIRELLGMEVVDPLERCYFIDLIEYTIEVLLYGDSFKYDHDDIIEILTDLSATVQEANNLIEEFKRYFHHRLGVSGVWNGKTPDTIYDFELRQAHDRLLNLHITIDPNHAGIGSRRQ